MMVGSGEVALFPGIGFQIVQLVRAAVVPVDVLEGLADGGYITVAAPGMVVGDDPFLDIQDFTERAAD